MGTRSTTHIFDGPKHILSIYRQHDGYLDGHGREIAEYMAGVPITNGINGMAERGFTGVGDLAAQLLCLLKTGARGKPEIGNVYITTQDDRQAYNYFIFTHGYNEPIRMEVRAGDDTKSLFYGTPEEFLVRDSFPAETREKAIEHLVADLDNFDHETLLGWAKCQTRENLEALNDKELNEEFTNTTDKSIADYFLGK